MKPTIGRIVNYGIIPAIIVEVKEDDSLLLCVFDPDKGVRFQAAAKGEWSWPTIGDWELVDVTTAQADVMGKAFEEAIEQAVDEAVDEVIEEVKKKPRGKKK